MDRGTRLLAFCLGNENSISGGSHVGSGDVQEAEMLQEVIEVSDTSPEAQVLMGHTIYFRQL